MADFGSFEELVRLVDDDDGMTIVTAERLRDAAGWKRLTQGAIEDIANHLARRGLGSFPPMAPGERWAQVRVYRRGTTFGNMIDAVIEPSEAGDRRLRDVAADDATETLAKIRKLVCD